MLLDCGCLLSSVFIRVRRTHPSYDTVVVDDNEDEEEHKTSMTDEMSLKLTSHYPPAIGIFTIYITVSGNLKYTRKTYIFDLNS